jgi:superfamily I DNA/RNA helicase
MKDTRGVKGQGEAIQFQMYQNAEVEALAVSNTVQELLQQDYQPGDFFIGARTRAQLGYVEGALVRAGIKFINITGDSFWQSKHVADIVAYLRLAHDTGNSQALERIYNIPTANHVYTWNDGQCKKCKGTGIKGTLTVGTNKSTCSKCHGSGFEKTPKFKAGDYCPTRYLGKEFLTKIRGNFNSIDRVIFGGSDSWRYKTRDKDYALYGPTKAQDLQEFVWRLQELLLQAENMGQVIRAIIDDCYEKYLRYEGAGDDGLSNAKLEDLATVEDLASKYNSPEDFLAFVDENIKAAEDAKNKDWQDYVVLSTIHRLKGLERKVIFGLGWCEGINVKTDEPVGLLPHTFSLTPPPDFGPLPSGGMSCVDDERCCAFVLITRASERVYLSGIENYRNWQMWPSRFIKEMELENETKI